MLSVRQNGLFGLYGLYGFDWANEGVSACIAILLCNAMFRAPTPPGGNFFFNGTMPVLLPFVILVCLHMKYINKK